MLPTGGAWQRRSARPGQWQPPCGLPCRARLRGSIAPCRAYQSLGNISKALEHHNEHLTIAKEVGDRAGEGQAYGNLGIAYDSQGDYAKAIEYHAQHLAIAKEVGDRAEEEYGASGTRIIRLGTMRRHSSTTRSTWRLQRRWATGRGRAGRTRTSGARIRSEERL